MQSSIQIPGLAPVHEFGNNLPIPCLIELVHQHSMELRQILDYTHYNLHKHIQTRRSSQLFIDLVHHRKNVHHAPSSVRLAAIRPATSCTQSSGARLRIHTISVRRRRVPLCNPPESLERWNQLRVACGALDNIFRTRQPIEWPIQARRGIWSGDIPCRCAHRTH